MKTRTAVMALCIAAVITAISATAALWPELPKRTTPPPLTLVPMTGDTVALAKDGCLAPMIATLQKQPNWSLRIDDMRWTDYTSGDDDPKHAQIVVDNGGATWRNEWLHAQTLKLTTDELRDAMAAFALSCEVDETLEKSGYEGRYIAIAYGANEKATARLRYNSPVVVALGKVFDAVRARYVANRAGAAKDYVVKLTGVRREGPNEWNPYTLVIDTTKLPASDRSRVDFVDFLLQQPPERPSGKLVANGTLTLAGVTKPISVSLEMHDKANELVRQNEVASELSIWISINYVAPGD